ncbi:hypothetical protein KIH86_12610 [Paenibacillus sp. HN-1]|uniref:hypothetical protein n=1 Tax=Paenibacillus TaxID=44249 RepID=UPI001CA8CA6C|nr:MULTISPECIES: hypothetical protein [Paenibacillus]MBY9080941.1 hypothetical protein [Paenibacillus sp. CGMCC 1.18879]MBY9085067.1 hypothetical protein [Paenibacillus sinensis]
MKKMMLKASVAFLLLTQVVAGGIPAVAAERPASKVAAAATAAPVMTDNLAKYGLKKNVSFPVTVAAGGLSYTLHKIMIYDIDSAEAKAIRNKYGYSKNSDYFRNPKYFVWTKITIANNSKKVVQQNANDVSSKWFLNVRDSGALGLAMPFFLADKKNNTSALWDFKLNPGEKLSTYQGFVYEGKFNYLAIRIFFNGAFSEKFIVDRPKEGTAR